MTYAATTSVPVEKTKGDIEKLLSGHGADQFLMGWEDERALIGFRMHGRFIRMLLPLPQAEEFALDGRRRRTALQVEAAMAQATRARWRALLLVLKAKLEAVESGIETFDQAFLAHILLPDSTTTGEWMLPQIEQAYETGRMPQSLLALPRGSS